MSQLTPPNPSIQLRGRLNGAQRMRLRSLLPMAYSPIELSRHIGCTRRQFYRVYIPAGLPHSRDEKGRIWINGAKFRRWYEETYPKVTLGTNEAFCATCKRAMPIIEPQHIEKKGLTYAKSQCPHCRRTLIRFLTKRKDNR